ncbi:MAG: RluA family pseudouridine synthase [Oscillospiraceae bacterium]|nr:RluA family pseudouridine synthase [Oscillospiraceae bacterium]
MREFIVTKNDSGQRLDRFAAKMAPALPSSLLQRYFRTKDIKINGHWARPDARVQTGDAVRLYIPEEFFTPRREERRDLAAIRPRLDILYEDEHILLVNKQPGVLCHAAGGWQPDTLLAQIQAHTYQSGQWDPAAENSFTPALCNRIDRGTGGIVIAAKTAPALRAMDEKIRAREVEKEYLCVCLGAPKPAAGRLEGWLFKDAVKNQVYIKPRQEPGTSLAITDYQTLESRNGLSLVSCRLHTGRTHQIRVQMAHAGWPLLGDGKYGRERINRQHGESRQLLWSWRLTFRFQSAAPPLDYLNGQSFSVLSVPFVEKYFPGAAY